MSQEIQPLGDRVLIRLVEDEAFTKSGLVIPDTAKEKPQRGEVVAVGDDEEMIKVKVGDLVLFAKYSGTELRLDGADYLILNSADVLAILKRAAVKAA
ncbi:MAG: co-chaperone GroES [Actinomycetota bacterium]|jgi:chaperonin GroES|nr:co-chaperone GroES [Actinomycetota bacterium]